MEEIFRQILSDGDIKAFVAENQTTIHKSHYLNISVAANLFTGSGPAQSYWLYHCCFQLAWRVMTSTDQKKSLLLFHFWLSQLRVTRSLTHRHDFCVDDRSGIVPDQTGRVVLLDKGLKISQGFNPGPGPCHVRLTFVLPIFQHPVHVELTRIAQLLDERCWRLTLQNQTR